MKEYVASYKHEGEGWVLFYYAKDEADAKRKLQSIKGNAVYDGEVIVKTVDVSSVSKAIKWIKGVFVWQRNI